MSKATVRDPFAGMNKTELAYATDLALLKRAGELKFWAYESMKLRLADGAFYTPDFMVVRNDDVIEIHETKGFMREAARVRILVAAALHPFVFKLVRRVKGAWETEVVCGPKP